MMHILHFDFQIKITNLGNPSKKVENSSLGGVIFPVSVLLQNVDIDRRDTSRTLYPWYQAEAPALHYCRTLGKNI